MANRFDVVPVAALIARTRKRTFVELDAALPCKWLATWLPFAKVGRIQRTASARFSAVQMQKRLMNVVLADRTGSRAGAARRSEPLTRSDQLQRSRRRAGDGSWSPAPEPVRRRGLAGIRSGGRGRRELLHQRAHRLGYR